jgi:hypothetical protein
MLGQQEPCTQKVEQEIILQLQSETPTSTLKLLSPAILGVLLTALCQVLSGTLYTLYAAGRQNPQLSRSCTRKERLDPETAFIISPLCKVGLYQRPKEYIYCIHGRDRVHTSSRQDKCQGSMNINRYLKLSRS